MKISKLNLLSFIIFIIYFIFAVVYSYDLHIGDKFVTNYDELNYLQATNVMIVDIKSRGIMYVFANYYDYTQSIHLMHYFVLSFIRIVFNDSLLAWLTFQLLNFFIACVLLSKIFTLYGFNKKYEIVSFLFLVVNAPLLYLTFSIMRDVQIFLLMVLSVYLYKKNLIIPLILSIILLMTYRVNAAGSIILYIVIEYIINKRSLIKIKFNFMYFIYFLIFIVLLLGLNRITDNSIVRIAVSKISEFNAIEFIINYFKFFISPLPWSVDPGLPSYLSIWYGLSFTFTFCILLLVILCNKKFNYTFVLPILAMISLNVLIYSVEAGIGFRQTAVLIPWISIAVLLHVFSCSFRKIVS